MRTQRDQCHLKKILLFTFPKRPVLACHAGPHGAVPVLVRKQKEVRGRPRPKLYWDFCRVARAGQGRITNLGLTNMNNSWGRWGTGVSPSGLVPCPGVLCELEKGVVQSLGTRSQGDVNNFGC